MGEMKRAGRQVDAQIQRSRARRSRAPSPSRPAPDAPAVVMPEKPHTASRLRDMFVDALNAFENWGSGDPEPTVDLGIVRRGRFLHGRLKYLDRHARLCADDRHHHVDTRSDIQHRPPRPGDREKILSATLAALQHQFQAAQRAVRRMSRA
jgi:hypothetical protein